MPRPSADVQEKEEVVSLAKKKTPKERFKDRITDFGFELVKEKK